jgi:hypothetical protein
MSKNNKTKSKTSPKSNSRGCLCENGTYSKDCCKGNIINQGVGSLVGSVSSTVNNIDGTRTNVSVSG